MPEPGPVIYLAAEDDANEFTSALLLSLLTTACVPRPHRRWASYPLPPRRGRDTVAAAGKSGKVEKTALYQRLYEARRRHQAEEYSASIL